MESVKIESVVVCTCCAARHVSQSVTTYSGGRVCTSQTLKDKEKSAHFAMQKLSVRVITNVYYLWRTYIAYAAMYVQYIQKNVEGKIGSVVIVSFSKFVSFGEYLQVLGTSIEFLCFVTI